jgi:CheY-like chemotaxis protein
MPTEEIHASVAPPLIVYAEDDDETRELVRLIFDREGFRVETAASAEGLIETVNRLCEAGDCPDVILSDVNFFNAAPRSGVKLTGIGAASQIHTKFPNLPILFLTAYGDLATRQNARDASNSELLAKPFDPRELVERVLVALALQAPHYEGRERRRNSINRTGLHRRKTDTRIEIPHVVAEALRAQEAASGE